MAWTMGTNMDALRQVCMGRHGLDPLTRLSAVSSPAHPSPSVAARKVICQVCLPSAGLQDKGLIGESAEARLRDRLSGCTFSFLGIGLRFAQEDRHDAGQ